MSKRMSNEIMGAIRERMSAKQLSQNKLAKELGISAAQLSNVLNADMHQKVGGEMWQRLAFKLGLNSHWEIVSTANFNSTVSLCTDTQATSRMVGIVGRSGYGKTTALRHYANNTPNVYYVFCDSLMSRRDFLETIARTLGISVVGNISRLQREISEYLATMERPLIIFDDPGKLKWSNHQIIQRLYDANTGQLGIVVAGTPVLRTFIDKGVVREKLGFDEYDRRIEYWLTLQKPCRNTVAHFCQQHGITHKDSINYVYRVADNYGTLKAVITNAKKLAQGNTISLDYLTETNVRKRA